jgi:hypothetical protein
LNATHAVHDEVRAHVADAEHAAATGDRALAAAKLVEAGRSAAADEQWRVAVRCYRAALAIDLFDRRTIARLLVLGARAGDDWSAYARTIDRVDWPRFGCRGATIVTGHGETVVRCPDVGAVLVMAMPERDLVEARAAPRFAGMPLAMALVILHRALWPDVRALRLERRDRPAMQVGVRFDGKELWLDELGDWRPR